jgi:hypothetical protein
MTPGQPRSGSLPKFRAVVITPERVRAAFPAPAVARWWWAALLWLHGKPAPGTATADQTAACVAAGFRFYARLYGLLGLLFLLGSAAGLPLAALAGGYYWPLMGGTAGAYLLVAACVARAGAAAYSGKRESGVLLLALFLGMAAVFLALFLGVASSAAEQLGVVPGWVNVAAVWGLVVFGIGSYSIELVYLVHVAFETQIPADPGAVIDRPGD